MEKLELKRALITPKVAMELLKTNTRNRPLNKKTVSFYADQMQRGLWKFNGEPIIISDDNTLLDGQHRLAAIVKSNTNHICIITTGINKSAFDTIDVGRARTGGDMLSLLGVKDANKISAIISSYQAFKLQRTSANGSVDIKVSKQEIIAAYNSSPDFWHETKLISGRCYEKIRLLSAARLGGYIALLTKEKGHDFNTVSSFFEQLFFDENVQNNTIRVLRETLVKSLIGQYKITPTLQHIYIVKTFNSFMSGTELKRLCFNVERDQTPDFL